MKNTKKGFVGIVVLIILAIAVVGGGVYVATHKTDIPTLVNINRNDEVEKNNKSEIILSTTLENDLKSSISVNPEDVTVKDISSAEYKIGDEKIKFMDGKFRRGIIRPISSDFLDAGISKYSFGDVNGDNKKDALVITSFSLGNAVVSDLHIVFKTEGKVVSKRLSVPLQSGYSIRNYADVDVKNGIITIKLDIMAPGDARCCPSIVGKPYTYIFDTEKMVLILNPINQ